MTRARPPRSEGDVDTLKNRVLAFAAFLGFIPICFGVLRLLLCTLAQERSAPRPSLRPYKSRYAGVTRQVMRRRTAGLPAIIALAVAALVITVEPAGAEARKVMGMAVFSGMLAATALGVFFVPLLFVVIEKMRGGGSPAPADPAAAGRKAS